MKTTINSKMKFYKLTGTDAILGSAPGNSEVYSAYIASKAPKEKLADAEVEADMLPEDKMENKMTVFLRDGHGHLCIKSYIIEGFFKAALNTLKEQLGIKSVRSKVDNLVFAYPTYIPFRSGDDYYTKEDFVCERPLRAQTMQGERVALAASEALDAGWELYIAIKILDNTGTKSSKEIDFTVLETALDYGELKGLGQWRNAGNGRFKWQEISEEEYEMYCR